MPSDLVIVAKKATWDEKQENRRIAKAYASAGWGWSGKEWVCLRLLWTYESRFDHLAKNPPDSAISERQKNKNAHKCEQLIGHVLSEDLKQ